ncbi:hypothetical protein CABS01_04737 [Colletotrichum abscissum]|uniref:Uncharacterized protein n=1 Tax=Colletotrichum abscissum TaxID=1671311 RepID=A0A9Q0B1M3_9PEZI|nr:uncharacterized protein CABS01_04737 [Colletotrichum abscissum]KAI3540593.1 hypothetical protein CABS02_11006 [Colletotrichum abscissum]KAK1472094.1 hypothetical protein CABS01_04737 [Colletotrichum abscissum]
MGHVPPVDAAESKALQRFAQQQRPGLLDIPSICLFPVAQRGLEADITGVRNEEFVAGASKSEGYFVEAGSVAELFQHGYEPFGGDQIRPHHLERLLDHWRGLLNEDVWGVGPQGMEGSI